MLRSELALTGEPILARAYDVIVLESATLIVNATIKEIQYGRAGMLPSQSFFDSFIIEISAWAKDDAQVDDGSLAF